MPAIDKFDCNSKIYGNGEIIFMNSKFYENGKNIFMDFNGLNGLPQFKENLMLQFSWLEEFRQGKVLVVKLNNILRSIFWFLSLIFGVFKINFKPTFLEILFGLTHHSTKQYPQMLQNFFFN